MRILESCAWLPLDMVHVLSPSVDYSVCAFRDIKLSSTHDYRGSPLNLPSDLLDLEVVLRAGSFLLKDYTFQIPLWSL